MSVWVPLLSGLVGGALAALMASRSQTMPPTTLDGASGTSVEVYRFEMGRGPWQRFRLTTGDGRVVATGDDGTVLFDVPARTVEVRFPRHGAGAQVRWPEGKVTFTPYQHPGTSLPASARTANHELAARLAAMVQQASTS